ncbi:MAG: tRNA (adenosine(37)-N6)-threonylcarbamoyltransferase complex ATPase subunit type 1 TsaE [Desulfobacterales bacterium]|nr:tRNA (adenosine(37)-N6)-threonylcarbamoyltransferase complex ATPase subunit type 1 TsaE [Desulfobacterales bacterium]
MKYEVITKSSNETRLLGEEIGKSLEKGNIIAIYGELGSGKTVLVQGIAKGLKISEQYYVTSPTYTIINEYSGICSLFHIDLYRINDIEELEDIGFREIIKGEGIVAIEWPERIPNDYLKWDMVIVIDVIDEETRKINVTIHKP